VNVCFTLRNSKNAKLAGTIYVRVSMSGRTSNVSTSVKTYKKNWTGSQVKGVENSKQLNMELQKIKSDLFAIYYDLKATEPENLSLMPSPTFISAEPVWKASSGISLFGMFAMIFFKRNTLPNEWLKIPSAILKGF